MMILLTRYMQITTDVKDCLVKNKGLAMSLILLRVSPGKAAVLISPPRFEPVNLTTRSLEITLEIAQSLAPGASL
jgi:hypothetical protein